MRRSTLRSALILLFAMMGGAVAAQSGPATRHSPDGKTIAGSPARGLIFARRECASCHTVQGDAASPRLGAPTFEQIARIYQGYRLDWELETISQVGHYAMPTKPMSGADIADVTAYVASLKPAR